MAKFNVTKYCKTVDTSYYVLDVRNKVFCTEEDDLVLDFSNLEGWTFDTGRGCTFITGDECTFNTGEYCTFKTRHDCTFNTGEWCTFNTLSGCTFATGELCVFSVYAIGSCKFKTYDNNSIILDRVDKQRYVLTKKFMSMLKVKNG